MTTISQCAGIISFLSAGESRAEDVKIALARIAIHIRELAAGYQETTDGRQSFFRL